MGKLKLQDIEKVYPGGQTVRALQGVSPEFRENEFVAILGPSGCGKTTLLNVIGGLDRYTGGDLMIRGVSTKRYNDSDWDAYRNRSVGFVFQNYHLITHQTVVKNVEIALTLSGVPKGERRLRALEALSQVGLADQARKLPNELSGGQMQRVAIARALVGQPDIILADEPTGALDSHTGEQVMELLRDAARNRLVIMVTHNSELADRYATRTIHLHDGQIVSDSHPPDDIDDPQRIAVIRRPRRNRIAMNLPTALSLSFRNLLTKKGRTLITSFAGSIGIIGVSLVLALSAGLSDYMSEMQSDALSGFPITISSGEQSMDLMDMVSRRPLRNISQQNALPQYPDDTAIVRYDRDANVVRHANTLTPEYLEYIAEIETALPGTVSNISYTHGVSMNVLTRTESGTQRFETRGNTWQELPDNRDFLLSLYDVLGENGTLPREPGEIALVVDEYNRLDVSFLNRLGLYEDVENYRFEDFVGRSLLRVVPNDLYYQEDPDSGLFTAAAPAAYGALFEKTQCLPLTITCILRLKEGAASSYLNPGLAYTPALTDWVLENAVGSAIANAQAESDFDVLTGLPFPGEEARQRSLYSLGSDTSPTAVSVYPRDFAGKDAVKEYLQAYNNAHEPEQQVLFSDMAEMITSLTGTLLDTVSAVLVGFAAISLIVSTIMIGIITYVSVLERTREIGILRSVGARKRDVFRVFSAETLIIGFTAGILGVTLSLLLLLPINFIIERMIGLSSLAHLRPTHALLLILGSMALTLISGMIPSRAAAQKDPVAALRTD